MSAPAPAFAERVPIGVVHLHERLVPPCVDKRRVVKLVSAQHRAARTEGTCREQPRAAITEMQAPFGKAGRMREQARHGMSEALSIGQGLTQHHVATALAMYR